MARYVKYRLLHSWVFVWVIVFWLICSVILFGFIWEQWQDFLWLTFLLSGFLLIALMVAWSGIVNRMNIRLEKKIVYPIVDKLLAKSTSVLSKKYRVKRRELVRIDDGDASRGEPYEAVVVFLADGSVCGYPFPFVTLERNGSVIVRSLSLTHYVCNDERLIAKAKSWFPEISFNIRLKIISFLILVFGGVVSSVILALSQKAFSLVFLGLLVIITIYAILYARSKQNDVDRGRCRKIFDVMSIPIGVVGTLLTLGMSFLSVAIVTFISVFAAVIPPIVIVSVANMINDVSIDDTTMYFVVLVCSSFIIVYCPYYIKGIINRLPFVTYTEGKQHKKRLADFIRYVYDAGVVEFLLNVTYVIFVCIICIKKYQNSGNLFCEEIDDVILNAFIVFLAFEGVRSSYKRIRLSARSFFLKIMRTFDSL